MGNVQVTFLGSGDAFGSGGRFNTCIHVREPGSRFLIDCGASSMIAMRKYGVNPNDIGTILITHLHGDHFGGIPFFILDARLVSKRSGPLTIAGPAGTGKRIAEAMEVMFPGSSRAQQNFLLGVIDLQPEQPRVINGITVTPYQVQHPSGDPPLALRIECGGKTIAYSGDTEWAEALVPAAGGSDLFISECYYFDKKVKFHMDYRTLEAHLGEIRPGRLIITHMSGDMLARLKEVPCEHAEDGMTVHI